MRTHLKIFQYFLFFSRFPTNVNETTDKVCPLLHCHRHDVDFLFEWGPLPRKKSDVGFNQSIKARILNRLQLTVFHKAPLTSARFFFLSSLYNQLQSFFLIFFFLTPIYFCEGDIFLSLTVSPLSLSRKRLPQSAPLDLLDLHAFNFNFFFS